MDPSIPNVEEWNPSKVTTYFLQQGFRPDVAGIFMNEVIFVNSEFNSVIASSDIFSLLFLPGH